MIAALNVYAKNSCQTHSLNQVIKLLSGLKRDGNLVNVKSQARCKSRLCTSRVTNRNDLLM